MSDGTVITKQECSAKDGGNLADLGSPLCLLSGHRFLLGFTWTPSLSIAARNLFIDEHRCVLNHFLAKCSMSDRPGLDVRAGLWRETPNREPGGKSVNKQLPRSMCKDLCSTCSSVHMSLFVPRVL